MFLGSTLLGTTTAAANFHILDAPTEAGIKAGYVYLYSDKTQMFLTEVVVMGTFWTQNVTVSGMIAAPIYIR